MKLPALPDTAAMYGALTRKDGSFEGIFVAGVKTTGIFCRPTCTARKPQPENVEFFATARDALQHGYRPCKICRPMRLRGETPGWLEPLLKEIDLSPDMRIKDADLRQRGIDPDRLRRWFLKNHDMTFQAYLRTLRIGRAFGRIRQGETVIDAAFQSGYESLSGFTDVFKKMIGSSPRKSRGLRLITVTRALTPLGPMLAGATDRGICLLEFIDRRMLETQIARLKRRLGAEMVPGASPVLDQLQAELAGYFAGTRQAFTVPLEPGGTPFQQTVWTALQTIPYAETRSYSQQAASIGKPDAVRAVARANGDNRIAIIIPCHRVVGKNGELTGYGGGLWRKRHLLAHEKEIRGHNT